MSVANVLAHAPKPLPLQHQGPLLEQSFLHRFTVPEYRRMVDTGFLSADDRVELLDGWIVDKMPHNAPHDGTVHLSLKRLNRVIPDDCHVRIQAALELSRSCPEPDLLIVQGLEEVYLEQHPTASDVLAAMEVADATLDRDRTLKHRIYARAKIPVYWIINLVERQVEVYTMPKAGRNAQYQTVNVFTAEQSVPLVLRGRLYGPIPVADLLPPKKKSTRR